MKTPFFYCLRIMGIFMLGFFANGWFITALVEITNYNATVRHACFWYFLAYTCIFGIYALYLMTIKWIEYFKAFYKMRREQRCN